MDSWPPGRLAKYHWPPGQYKLLLLLSDGQVTKKQNYAHKEKQTIVAKNVTLYASLS